MFKDSSSLWQQESRVGSMAEPVVPLKRYVLVGGGAFIAEDASPAKLDMIEEG